MKRRKKMAQEPLNFQAEKFKVFVRYLIQVAKDKRCVSYVELENVFVLSHKQAGMYAGRLGDYCHSRKIPPLNGLIINSTDCIPSHGFDWYQKQYKKSWGEVVADCWSEFHVTSTRGKQVQDFSKRDKDIDVFLEEE
jgi:hypothetical protein